MYRLNKEKYKLKNFLETADIGGKVEYLKKEGKIIGLCTGSFDLLHPGHIAHINQAKEHCDVLLVGVAIDSHSSKKSGKGRPVYSDYIRAYMIGNLKAVDYVFFEDGTPNTQLIVKPHVFIKGPEYTDEKNPGIIAQKEFLKQWGGKIVYTTEEKLSTTDIIRHIKEEVLPSR